MTEFDPDKNHDSVVRSAEAIDETQDRLAEVHQNLTGVTKVEVKGSSEPVKEVSKAPEPSKIYTDQQIEELEKDLDWRQR